MSGTGYQDSKYVKTSVCKKCKQTKTWNYWYHFDEELCDDCYYIDGKYNELNKDKVNGNKICV